MNNGGRWTYTVVEVLERQLSPVSRQGNHRLACLKIIVEYVVHVDQVIVVVIIVEEHIRNAACWCRCAVAVAVAMAMAWLWPPVSRHNIILETLKLLPNYKLNIYKQIFMFCYFIYTKILQ